MPPKPTLGQRAADELKAARAKAGTLPWEEVASIIDRCAAQKKTKRTLPINKMTDEEFMSYLRAEPTLAGIDIGREIGKCQFHFKAKGIVPSRMRLINWLNRADKTLARFGVDSAVRVAAIEEQKKQPPDGWREFMQIQVDAWTAEHPGYDAPGLSALAEGNFFGMPKSWRDECWARPQPDAYSTRLRDA